MICNGQDPDVDVTGTRHQGNGEETRESGMSVWQKITAVSVKNSLWHST